MRPRVRRAGAAAQGATFRHGAVQDAVPRCSCRVTGAAGVRSPSDSAAGKQPQAGTCKTRALEGVERTRAQGCRGTRQSGDARTDVGRMC
jgi:hypothetical protein